MNNLATKIAAIFDNNLGAIINDKNHTSHYMASDNLLTKIICNYRLCSVGLKDLTSVFNESLKASSNDSNVIKAFITGNEEAFRKVESVFQHSKWSTNYRVRKFNKATRNTSECKCTTDNKFYIIKCYDHFYYIYNTESNQCLMVTKDEKKALTMVNILLLTPYLLYGDLFAVHGGLVSNGANNILIGSSSLGGKTTFSLLFLENGWQIVTEETTYITKHGNILNYNIRNYFNIRVGTYLEFKDLFIKAGIINDTFLTMADLDRKELFELGKEAQMSIDFESLSKNDFSPANIRITHVLKVSLEKNRAGMIIKKIKPKENVGRFLEVSLAPTVMLFRGLTGVTNLRRDRRRAELMQIFKKVESYSVVSGFNYRNDLSFLLNKIKLINTTEDTCPRLPKNVDYKEV